MTRLLELMKDGRAWSIEALAEKLDTTEEDVRRQMDYLERLGFLRRVGGCGHNCKGCSAHCGAGIGLSGMPVFWEVANHEMSSDRRYPQ